MQLRAHQKTVSGVVEGIIGGSGVRDIVAHVTPGGGKSTLPIQAGQLITAGLADKICWIAPRMSLQDQAERNFTDPRFRELFNHRLTIRTATNDHNPSRGLNGFVSTYQALAVDDQKTVLRDFERYRYILVLDEFHHLEAEGEWTAPIKELYDRAAYRVLMTGTLARGDERRIAFVPYREYYIGDFAPCFDDKKDTALITYTRKDALADQAIIPLEFHFADGVAEWRKESGKLRNDKISSGQGDANQALYTALNTEYAEELLVQGVDHWQKHIMGEFRPRKTIITSHRLLVVAASIKNAEEYTAILKRKGLHAEIATSDDTKGAVRNINALKAGRLRILVTVAMAYEGLDCPSISHIICLTNTRSLPWIEQMVARAVRIDPQAGPYESQRGYIFAPADRMFTEIAAQIEADQCQAVAKVKAPGAQGNLFGDGEGGGGRPGITPLSSRLLHGQQIPFAYHNQDTATPIRTQREIEDELRREVDRHVKTFCRVYNVRFEHLNADLKKRFGKARELMTVAELEELKRHLAVDYTLQKAG